MKKPVVTVPEPFLNQPTKKVTQFDEKLKGQIQEMLEVLRTEKGIGIAANQIGYDNNVILVEFEDPEGKNHIPFTVVINPEIVEKSEELDCFEEGCLSVPKVELDVDRAKKIKIKYQNEEGKVVKASPKSLLARVLQHEVDHLNGIIFTERIKEQFFQKNPDLKDYKIVFCGSGEFAAIILKGLILLGFNLEIITEKGKPAGRDREIQLTPVAAMAKTFNKDYIEVDNISHSSSLIPQHDLFLCTDFGQKIPDSMLEKAINIHPSLLPKFRGPSPIQAAILKGVKETGISIIKMTNTIDGGPVLVQMPIEIMPDDDYLVLRDRLATAGLKALVTTLPDIARDKLQAVLQDEAKATFTKKFTKDDGKVNWGKSPKYIDRQIRALYPWPGTFTMLDDKRLIIHKAHLEKTSNLKPQISKLVLDIVQPEGGKPMKWADFLRGYKGEKPEWFDSLSLTE